MCVQGPVTDIHMIMGAIKIIPAMALLASVLVALLAAGGCSKNEQKTAEQVNRAATEKGQMPYYDGLIEEYQNVLVGDPHNLVALIALGNAYYDSGKWKLAIQYYEQALLLDPHQADIITDIGTCFRNLGMPDRAITLYERTLAIEPTHQNTLFNLGVVYGYDRKDYAKAIRYWEQLLHVSPKHPKAEYLQATMAQFKKAMRQSTN
ncbi:MAG: tetratricopeptide repeat protein [Nitrospirae bacterium]|nr:tetratricopeptide repeat protein [Nitrospirota bacterium]NTW66915.1 tetratricopeptide repeat protein [Nitrospirota bacterium]